MPTLNIGEPISQWDTTRLIRFVKDLFERDPPTAIGSTTIENLAIASMLIVQDQIRFTRDPNFHAIGGTGEPVFENSWVNWGSPYNPASFWKDPFGFIHLQGVIKSGTVGSTAFTLPVGSRPVADGIFSVVSNGAFGRVDIASDGTVKPISPSSNVYVSLDNISFKAQ
jgi:hypothetical protein